MTAVARKKQLPLPKLNDALNGVYVDFESNVGRDPTLLGILLIDGSDGDVFEQHVIESGFEAAASAKGLKAGGHCVVSSPTDAVRRVIELADGRRVFAYAAKHEQDLINEIPGGRELASSIEDVLPWARLWKRRMPQYRDVAFTKTPGSGRNSLRNMAALIDIGFSPFLGNRRVGPNLSRVRSQLESKGSWTDLPGGAKKAWSRVLRKNEWDCRTTRTLLCQIVEDLNPLR